MQLVAIGLWLVKIGVGLFGPTWVVGVLGPACGLLGCNRHGVGVLGLTWVVGWLRSIGPPS